MTSWSLGGRFLWVLFLAVMAATALPGVAQAGKPYDLSKVLKMSDRAKSRLPRRTLNRAIRKYGLKAVALRRSFVKKHNNSYKVTIPKPLTYKVRDQCSSGNCWIFASGRVMASKMHRNGRTAPMLSSTFVNYYNMRQTARALLSEFAKDNKGAKPDLSRVSEADEGGFQIWAMDIIKKHGYVPAEKMPLTADGSNPGLYINRLQSMLAKAQRDFSRAGKAKAGKGEQRALLQRYNKQVDQLLGTALGKPPARFTYNGKKYTPKTFAKKYLGVTDNQLDYVTLTNYSNRGYNRRYESGVSPGMNRFNEYNVSMDVIQQAIKRTVRKGEAVLFGVNVDSDNPHRADIKGGSRDAKGILSLSAFNYRNLIPSSRLAKRDKLNAGLAGANHAMAITGYDPAPGKRGSVRKWRVENSHGIKAGDKGFFHMYDDYMRHHVEDVVVPRWAVPKHILKKADARAVIKDDWNPGQVRVR